MARTSSNTSTATLNWGDRTVLDGATSGFWAFWANIAAWTDSNETMWNKDDFPANAAGWLFQRNGVTDALKFQGRGAGAPGGNIGGAVAGTGWQHYAVHVENNLCRVWRNGSIGTLGAAGSTTLGNNANNLQMSVRNSGVAVQEAAIWANLSLATSTAFVALLAAGRIATAMSTQPGFYAPLACANPEPDLISGTNATVPANSACVAGPSTLVYPAGTYYYRHLAGGMPC